MVQGALLGGPEQAGRVAAKDEEGGIDVP